MEVVIWKVVLPSGTEVKGTVVGDTSPRVYKRVSQMDQVVRVSDIL